MYVRLLFWEPVSPWGSQRFDPAHKDLLALQDGRSFQVPWNQTGHIAFGAALASPTKSERAATCRAGEAGFCLYERAPDLGIDSLPGDADVGVELLGEVMDGAFVEERHPPAALLPDLDRSAGQ